jgi:hypothetical protein
MDSWNYQAVTFHLIQCNLNHLMYSIIISHMFHWCACCCGVSLHFVVLQVHRGCSYRNCFHLSKMIFNCEIFFLLRITDRLILTTFFILFSIILGLEVLQMVLRPLDHLKKLKYILLTIQKRFAIVKL